MTITERRAIIGLASIMSIRMLGLFMIFPVFTLYARDLPNTTPLLIGLAIGIYGLTQGLLQIPFGMLSDRIGRKPIIYIGLFIFAVGSVVAAMSDTITGIIIGRALQGCGAISSTILALTADLTLEQHRTKAMAILGMSIGTSFILALVLGPFFAQWVGVPGLFWFTAIFALIGIIILYRSVPQPHSHFHSDTSPVLTQFKRVLHNTELLRLDFGILVLHLFLTSMFVVLPIVLIENNIAIHDHWQVYTYVLLASVATMIPLIIIAEKYRHLKLIFVGSIAILGVALITLSYLHANFIWVIISLFLFFTGVNVLEASLPSLISKISPSDSKGTAMGVYSSSQFFGAFLGGVGGGWLHQYYGIGAVFAFSASLALIWFIFAFSMKSPSYLSSYLLKLKPLVNKEQADKLTDCLMQVTGVKDVVIVTKEEIAYLKVDRKILDKTTLNKCVEML